MSKTAKQTLLQYPSMVRGFEGVNYYSESDAIAAMEEYRQQAPGMKWRCGSEGNPDTPLDVYQWRWKNTKRPTSGDEVTALISGVWKIADFEWLDESAAPVQLPTEEDIAAEFDRVVGNDPSYHPEWKVWEKACQFMASKLKGGNQ